MRVLSIDEREAFKLYKKNTPLSTIAEKMGIPMDVLERWHCQTDWDNYKTVVGEPGHVNTVNVGVGTGPGVGNRNGVKHGLGTNWLPKEMMDIINTIDGRDTIDLLYDQILVQYTAIARAQGLMFVKDIEDNVEYIKREGEGGLIERDIQYAWDRYGRYLAAQSTAMNSLNTMIQSYERQLRAGAGDEEQALRIKKLKKELETSRSVEDKMQEYFEMLAKSVTNNDR